jgi:hypothetical protein
MEDLRDGIYNRHKAGLGETDQKQAPGRKEDAMFYITGGHFSKRYLIKSILEGKV